MRAFLALVLCLLVAAAQAKGEPKRDFILNNRTMRFQPSLRNKKDERVPLTSACLRRANYTL